MPDLSTLAHTVDWNNIAWLTVRGGMERKTFAGAGATLALFRIQPGHDLLPHAHHYEQIVYMLSGTGDFHVGDDIHRLTAGCLLVIPPHVIHYIQVQGDEPVLELDVFTPRRDEYGG